MGIKFVHSNKVKPSRVYTRKFLIFFIMFPSTQKIDCRFFFFQNIKKIVLITVHTLHILDTFGCT